METDKQIRIHLCCKSGAFRQRYKFVIVTGPVCFYAGGGTVKIFSGKCINDLEINRFFFGTTVCCTEVFTAVSRIKNDNIFINLTGTIYCDEKIIALSGILIALQLGGTYRNLRIAATLSYFNAGDHRILPYDRILIIQALCLPGIWRTNLWL